MSACSKLWFAELEVAHQVIGQVHAADLDLGSRLADGADELAAHAVVLKAEDVLDKRARLGAEAVGRLLLVVQGLVPPTLLAEMALVARSAQGALGLFAAVGAVGPDVRISVVGVDDGVEDLAVVDVRRGGLE